jgi:hypothetical protein
VSYYVLGERRVPSDQLAVLRDSVAAYAAAVRSSGANTGVLVCAQEGDPERVLLVARWAHPRALAAAHALLPSGLVRACWGATHCGDPWRWYVVVRDLEAVGSRARAVDLEADGRRTRALALERFQVADGCGTAVLRWATARQDAHLARPGAVASRVLAALDDPTVVRLTEATDAAVLAALRADDDLDPPPAYRRDRRLFAGEPSG